MEVKGEKKDLPFAELRVLAAAGDGKPVEEIKFGNGDNRKKSYRLELASAALADACSTLAGSLETVNRDGQDISLPVIDGQTYTRSQGLRFYEPFIAPVNRCEAHILDSLDGEAAKDHFFVSNRKRQELASIDSQAVLYGGIGNHLRVTVGPLKKDIPIEPVGVIVLAIDGLRQDVLYAPQNGDDDGTGVHASYNDPTGCVTGSCYVPPQELKGMCDVLGGKIKYNEVTDPLNPDLTIVLPTGACLESGWTDRHIKLPDVTAIFPSITYASWASIFSGKQAGQTGIMGNEYFARDLYAAGTIFPGLSWSPPGMITYSDGAFGVGCGWTGLLSPLDTACFYSKYILPADWHDSDGLKEKALPRLTLQVPTVYEEITPLLKGFHTPPAGGTIGCDTSAYECRSAVVFSQYAKGADTWRTMSGFLQPIWRYLTGGEANVMDSTPAYEAKTFINNYFAQPKPDGTRKRFPALFTVYFAGLDHEAHGEGMGKYRKFFTDTTDAKVGVVIKALKDQDEFENKIFIVVADHGHTAMPEDLRYERSRSVLDADGNIQRDISGNPELITDYPPADLSCSLNQDFRSTDKQEAERGNNNLHIWELGEMFQQLDPAEGWKLLVPGEIEHAIIAGLKQGEAAAVTSEISQANVIAALNGPMAHLYVKGAGGWEKANSDSVMLGKIADKLSMYFVENGAALSEWEKEPFPRILASIDKILLRINGDYAIFKGLATNEDGSISGLATPGPLSELGANQDYVKAVMRVGGMNNLSRSGDIVLLMKDGFSEPVDSRYTTGVACKSWHGSLNKSDSYVPFIVAYPGGNKQELDSSLEMTCPGNTCEGNWVLPTLIKKIVEAQYTGQ
jgi:hypothetical protein